MRTTSLQIRIDQKEPFEIGQDFARSHFRYKRAILIPLLFIKETLPAIIFCCPKRRYI